MKTQYEAPKMIQVALQTRHLFSSSTITQDVYTDDPVTTDQALIKGQSSSIWDDEW